jgi:hypothetical protein
VRTRARLLAAAPTGLADVDYALAPIDIVWDLLEREAHRETDETRSLRCTQISLEYRSVYRWILDRADRTQAKSTPSVGVPDPFSPERLAECSDEVREAIRIASEFKVDWSADPSLHAPAPAATTVPTLLGLTEAQLAHFTDAQRAGLREFAERCSSPAAGAKRRSRHGH